MMRVPFDKLAAAALAALAIAASLAAATARVAFTDTKLKNGLRVIVSEDHVAPVFSVAVSYNVGSRDERAGRTGFAHLFEHMMFKGSANVGTGEHFYTIFSNGGTMNGTTNKERTIYYETMPSNQLDAALFLEADRMRSLAIVKENLDNQRNAVQEERRLSYDNQPYGRADEAIDDLAFDNFSYKHSVIGSMADLNAASIEDVAAFFKTYYAPNNAILAIAGDVNTARTLERVRTYFEVVGGNVTGRLFLHLREAKGYTYGASSAVDARQHRGDWAAATNVRTEVTEPALRDLLDEIRQMRDVPVPDQEMADARRSMIASFALSLESPQQLLGLYVTSWRYKLAADYWDRYAERITAVTRDQVQAVARKYLAADRLQIVAVGDPGPIAAPLKTFGVVEVYDANGKRLEN